MLITTFAVMIVLSLKHVQTYNIVYLVEVLTLGYDMIHFINYDDNYSYIKAGLIKLENNW